MNRIWVVDNGGQWTHLEYRRLKELGVEVRIIPNATPSEAISAQGLVLSGGAPRIDTEFAKLGRTAEYLNCTRIPILAICVAHQFLAFHFGGKAGPAKNPEYGRAEIVIDDPDELLKGIPKRFMAWESHNDEILRLPPDLIPLAHSADCRYQAIRHRTGPLYGVQFHPEVKQTEYGAEIFKNFIRLCKSWRI
jgi:GMP synthase (glutamine-hydrolysing)